MENSTLKQVILTSHPWSEPPSNESLGHRLERINISFGPFRNLCEESLQSSIFQDTSSTVSENLDETNSEQDASIKSIVDKLIATKQELLYFITSARHQILLCLDFISLLISKFFPKNALNSMSPAIKAIIPPETLAYDEWNSEHTANASTSPPVEEKNRQNLLLSLGWKTQGLSSISRKFRLSSNSLQNEINGDIKFWQQMLEIQRKGWAILRTSPHSPTFGVQIGALEASPQFRARGFARFARSSHGDIVLESFGHSNPCTVRVRIFRDETCLGTSCIPQDSNFKSSTNQANIPIEKQILCMQNALFEEELFFEMLQEARVLNIYGVQENFGCISIPVNPPSLSSISRFSDTQSTQASLFIHIDLYPVKSPQIFDHTISHSKDKHAEFIALLLRLLMSQTYTRRLHRRTDIPKVTSDWNPSPVTSSILTILISKLYNLESPFPS